MVQDLVYAVRNLRRYSLTGAAAVLTLGLGIGGTTAVFSVVDAVLLRPLPFDTPDRLVRIFEVTPDGIPFSFSAQNFLDLDAGTKTLERVAAFKEAGTMVLEGAGEPHRVVAVPISASLTEVVGVAPSVGRFFSRDEDRIQSAARPVVLASALWRARFGTESTIIGRAIRLDGEVFTVVGVMPPGFAFPRAADAWVPLRADPQADRDDKDLAVIGRLASGISIDQVRGELRAFGTTLSDAHPKANGGWSAGAIVFEEWLVAPRFRDAVWVLFGAVGLLLMLACANVANLLVAQGATRQGEMRIRAALGAGRARLARQLFTESAVLAALGTIAGLLISFWSIAAVRALGDTRLPRLEEVGVDATVLGFACLAGMASCLVFGLAPAFHAARVDLRAGMDAGVRHTTRGRRLRRILVVSEVALALLLLVGAGLLASSFARLIDAEIGFDPAGVVAMPLEVSSARYSDDRLVAFHSELLDRIRALPGVSGAAATSTDPFRQFGFSNNVTPEDRAATAPPSGLVQADWRSVTPGFFETLRIPVIAGRTFTRDDREGAERVVVANQSLARLLWPEGDAVGKRIYWGGTTGRTRTVVGVTADFQDEQLGAAPGPMLFVPHAQVNVPTMTVLVQTPLGAAAIAPALRAAVRSVDPALPAAEVHAIDASRAAAAAGPRFNTALLGSFAAIAFVLAITGVYAMLAFTAIERRRELAVRIALGASPREIVKLLVAGGLALTVGGLAVGLALAAGSTRVLRSLLFDVAPNDPVTFGAAALVLLAAAALACYLPARRAGQLDPLTVLRD
jgi:putative ABC transport system permease protein